MTEVLFITTFRHKIMTGNGAEPREEEDMREGIHPKYDAITVKCLCGNTFETRSTKSEISTEICSQCHPFYTGKQKLIDTAGRVERFRRRYNIAATPEEG